jgi:hypothetical protein
MQNILGNGLVGTSCESFQNLQKSYVQTTFKYLTLSIIFDKLVLLWSTVCAVIYFILRRRNVNMENIDKIVIGVIVGASIIAYSLIAYYTVF